MKELGAKKWSKNRVFGMTFSGPWATLNQGIDMVAMPEAPATTPDAWRQSSLLHPCLEYRVSYPKPSSDISN